MNNELYHHGILGQKWGIRRYQPYPDGSTSKGKYVGKPVSKREGPSRREQRRAARVEKANAKRQAVEELREEKKKYKEMDKQLDAHRKYLSRVIKYRSIMSPEELNSVISHIRLEQTVMDLTSDKSKMSAGREFFNKTIGSASGKVLETVATAAGKAGIAVAADKLGTSVESESASKFWKNFSIGVENKKK